MLRKTRILAALLIFVSTTLLFVDFTGALHHGAGLGWAAKIQLIPALLAANGILLSVLAALTLLFGRVYCSVICPLGIMQDIVSRLSSFRRDKKKRFRYAKARSWLRYGTLALYVLSFLAGVGAIVSLLDPYAMYGRIASNCLSPLYRTGNNGLAWVAGQAGSYAFYPVEAHTASLPAIGVAAATVLAVGILAWRNGRTYCNTVCPVGTILGVLSRFAVFRPAEFVIRQS